MKLGVLKRVPLREVWRHEGNDFSKWLAAPENMKLLSETVGIDLEPIEREAKIGKYWLDILARDAATGRTVVIENQLEASNHDHLGKIITYAAGKNADVVVWIVKEANEEHRQAIEWLNNRTDSSLGFFLLEIEMWSIGDSEPAPKFNVVEAPNVWGKGERESLSETQKLGKRFWTAFNAYAERQPEFMRQFNLRKAQPQNWYDFSIGHPDCHLCVSESVFYKEIRATVYTRGGSDAAERLKESVQELEKALKCEICEGTSKDKTFNIKHKIDFEKNEAKWTECFEWYCRMLPRIRDEVRRILGIG
jgi:hypothetical protein